MEARISKSSRDYYLKIASLCRLKKPTPMVQSLNIGTDTEDNILTDANEIDEHMTKIINREFSDNKNYKQKYDIGNISPITIEEL